MSKGQWTVVGLLIALAILELNVHPKFKSWWTSLGTKVWGGAANSASTTAQSPYLGTPPPGSPQPAPESPSPVPQKAVAL